MRRPRIVLLGFAIAGLVVGGAVAALRSDEGPDPDQAAFCTRLERLTTNDPFASFGDRATEAQIEQAFDALVERAEELLDLAPDDARPTAREFRESADELRQLLDDADGDPSRVDTRAYREQQVRYADAAALLERYLDSEC